MPHSQVPWGITLRNFQGTFSQPLYRGDRGVTQTISMMRDLIDDALKDPRVNAFAVQILQAAGVQNSDRQAKLRALYDWAANPQNWLYMEDPVGPHGPKETLRPVRTLQQVRAGDCDDATVLLAALAGTIGFSTRAVTIAAEPSDPREFSHIYPIAEVYPDQWIALDVARPGAAFGVEPPRYFRKRVWDFSSAGYEDLAGDGCACASEGSCALRSQLSGYVMLGQARPDGLATDISAVGQSGAKSHPASAASERRSPNPNAIGPTRSAPSREATIPKKSSGASPTTVRTRSTTPSPTPDTPSRKRKPTCKAGRRHRVPK